MKMKKYKNIRNVRVQDVENIFRAGMNAGYGIEHTNIFEDEENAVKEFMKQYFESEV